MALSKALSKSVLLREQGDLGAAVTALNAEIARDNAQDMFVTMLVGVIDLASGRVELCNAGHENPLRIDAGGTVSEIALVGGPPLCVADGFPYEAEAIRLSPGEGIAIVTDGITEAQDPAGDFFGHARLAAVLERWRGPASEAGDALLASVRAFEAGGESSDDVTVMALRWRG
jgi:serine phosphatase RsbU (regulator of sigma subunit)